MLNLVLVSAFALSQNYFVGCTMFYNGAFISYSYPEFCLNSFVTLNLDCLWQNSWNKQYPQMEVKLKNNMQVYITSLILSWHSECTHVFLQSLSYSLVSSWRFWTSCIVFSRVCLVTPKVGYLRHSRHLAILVGLWIWRLIQWS